MSITLVTGAANSGKSEWAECLACQSEKPVIYIATAQKNEDDREWQNKIQLHQTRRPKNWLTWETPYHLPSAISKIPPDTCVLVDSLGTWVANCLDKNDYDWQKQVNLLLTNCRKCGKKLIFVGEETGWGVVPAYQSGRSFRSRLGGLIRLIGEIADQVYLVVGGYAVDISKIGINLRSMIKSELDEKLNENDIRL